MKRFLPLLLTALLAIAQQPDEEALRIGPGMTPPKLTYKIEPTYSRPAANAGIQGTVLLDLIVDKNGLPRNIALLSPLGFGLDERAIDCVSQWRFKPALKQGQPVKVRAQVEVRFRLLGRSFDAKAEERRTRFNAIGTLLTRRKDGKPTPQEVIAMQDLVGHKLPAAAYLLGTWQIKGEVLPLDVTAGLANVQRAADHDYGPALFFIGQAQRTGNLFPKDPAHGLSLIHDAALLGSKEAQFALGGMYERGDSVTLDVARAKRYFRLCAAAAIPECEFRLGQLILASPNHSEEDTLQAVAWLQLADTHSLAAAHDPAETETAKLTPAQGQTVVRLRAQLELKP